MEELVFIHGFSQGVDLGRIPRATAIAVIAIAAMPLSEIAIAAMGIAAMAIAR
jgi:hypothetical protein